MWNNEKTHKTIKKRLQTNQTKKPKFIRTQ